MQEMIELARMVPVDDIRVVAVREALEPFAWRSFTAVSLCRRAVAALNGAGASAGQSDSSQSLPEECVEALVVHMSGCRWRSLTVVGLSRQLVGAAVEWQREQAWFDIQLGLLLDSAT